jgi:NADH-quinone oxidoreductase subunit A
MRLQDYAAILVFLILGLGFVLVSLYVIGWLVRPSRPSKVKRLTYECGERTVGEAHIQFRVIFYLFVLLFVIFDVEVAYIVPWAVVLRWMAQEGYGLFALWEMYVFLLILVLGLLYVWRKGVLKWD